jgi:hypothetical protein
MAALRVNIPVIDPGKRVCYKKGEQPNGASAIQALVVTSRSYTHGSVGLQRVTILSNTHLIRNSRSSFLFLRVQCANQNNHQKDLPRIKLQEDEQVTEKIALDSLRRALDRFSSLQASDGHWPGDFSGIMFIMPGLVGLNFRTEHFVYYYYFSFVAYI